MNLKKILFLMMILMSLLTVVFCEENKKDNQPNKEKKYRITFIELGSIRCIPCKAVQPLMDEIEKEYEGIVKVVFHDVWTPEGKPYAYKYKIQAIPTQIFLDENGVEYYRHQGFFPKEELVKILKIKL